MTEIVHTYEIYRHDNSGIAETHEEVFSNRETAESVRDALNAILAYDAYEKNGDKWTVTVSTINHAVVNYVPVFTRHVVTNNFTTPRGKLEFSSLDEGYPVQEGTELPETKFSENFDYARVFGFTFEEATANGEKAIAKMYARREELATQ